MDTNGGRVLQMVWRVVEMRSAKMIMAKTDTPPRVTILLRVEYCMIGQVIEVNDFPCFEFGIHEF